jgi:hypothetical protein
MDQQSPLSVKDRPSDTWDPLESYSVVFREVGKTLSLQDLKRQEADGQQKKYN